MSKKYDPELCLRASDKYEGNFYVYVDEYVINQLKEFASEAEAAYAKAKSTQTSGDRVSVGPIQFKILNEEDRAFFTERRKFKRAPDAVLRFQLPKEAKEDNTTF